VPPGRAVYLTCTVITCAFELSCEIELSSLSGMARGLLPVYAVTPTKFREAVAATLEAQAEHDAGVASGIARSASSLSGVRRLVMGSGADSDRRCRRSMSAQASMGRQSRQGVGTKKKARNRW
jgi:hypothetical protein